LRPLLTTAVVAAVAFVSAQTAAARPDAPLQPFLHHQAEIAALAWPADGTITDGFGPRWGRMHTGIDIGILRSPNVVAAASGRVGAIGILTGYEGYGTVVLVELTGGFEALYAHLESSSVRLGQWVAAGERIGTAGCTGYCTGTHLHFELRRDGVAIDPSPLLALAP
jgi:murein DD-endopeptidase MepM/ murein hydrolase activator NlpD